MSTEHRLAQERCTACEGGIPPLERAEAEALLGQLMPRWHLSDDGKRIEMEIKFKNFARALAFLNQVAEIAEAEGHHPDFCLFNWNRVRITLSTHAIGGLSRNDFILAAKIDELLADQTAS